MPPAYADREFWDTRFRIEDHFEWLGDGVQAIIPRIRTQIRAKYISQPLAPTPRTLHLGAGTSNLSTKILDVYEEVFGTPSKETIAVLDTDFADEAVRRGISSNVGGWSNIWKQLDALQWDSIRALASNITGHDDDQTRAFVDVVVDKSTSDAISCGENIFFQYGGSSINVHPMMHEHVKSCGESVAITPVELLALHLATIVVPGGQWIVLSYHSGRFPFLLDGGGKESIGGYLDVKKYWVIEDKEAVKAPSGQDHVGVHAPEVHHHVYVLRRTDTKA